MKNLFKLSVLAFAMLAVVACGKKETPEATAQKFLDCMNKKQWDDAKKLGTKNTCDMIDMLKTFSGASEQAAASTEKKEVKVENLKCDVQDTTAVCNYTQEGEQKKIDLVKRSGKWLVEMKKEGGLGGKPTPEMATDTTANAAPAAK